MKVSSKRVASAMVAVGEIRGLVKGCMLIGNGCDARGRINLLVLRWSLLANADAKLKEARRMPTSPVWTPRTLVYSFTFNHSLLSIHHFFCSEDLLVSSPQSKGLVLRGYDL